MRRRLSSNKDFWNNCVIIIGIAFVLFAVDPYYGKVFAKAKSFIDFGIPVGKNTLIYGANENNAWESFANKSKIQKMHNDVGTRSLRVWISAQHWRKSTYPQVRQGSYNYKQVDKFINAALRACVGKNEPLYITFAHGDICGNPCEKALPFYFNRCQGHASHPPSSISEFSEYVRNVVEHFKDMAVNGKYVEPCDPNNWYFEIWNEPTWGGGCWTDKSYQETVEAVSPVIKGIVPGAKIAAYRNADDTLGADYQVRHFYSDNYCRGLGKRGSRSKPKKLQCTGRMFFDASEKSELPIINSEYADDTGGYTYTEFAASWYAAALINQIKAGIYMEHYYAGTCRNKGLPKSGKYQFGMWGSDGTPWPGYYMKKQFVESHPSYPEPAVFFQDVLEKGFYSIATQRKDKKRFITIVNSEDARRMLKFELQGSLRPQTIELNFSALETKFLAESEDGSWKVVLRINDLH